MRKIERNMLYGIAIALALTGIGSLVMGIIHTVGANWELAFYGYFIFVLLIPVALFSVAMKRFIDDLHKW